MPVLTRPQKITFGEMRSPGVRGLLIYCADYHCSHSSATSAKRWPDYVQLSDIELAVPALMESAKIFLSRYARRTAPASLSGGGLGRFGGLWGWGRMARRPSICVRATRPPRGGGIMCPPSRAAAILMRFKRRADPFR
jgi:hypothetical protein